MNPINETEIPEEIMSYVGNLKKLTFPKQGWTSDVAVLDAYAGLFVLKRARTEQYCTWLEREVEVLKALEKTALPTPSVFQSVKEKNQMWMLMDWFNGQTLREYLTEERTQARRQRAIYNFGKILSTIHSTKCPDSLKGAQQWLEYMLDQAQYNLDHFEVDGSQDLLDSLIHSKPEPFRQTLIHGDFTIDNVLVNHKGEITGVIDWSGGAFGDPRYDVALAIRPKPHAFEQKEYRDAFFGGYGEKIISKKDYEYFDGGLYEFF